MAAYKLSQAAETKLAEIYGYTIVNFGLAQADMYLLSLHDIFQILAETPGMGRVYRNRRRHNHAQHVIFYRQMPDGIFVTQIFHHSEDIVARLR